MRNRDYLLELKKPGHYLGNEWGAVRKDPGSVSARVALAFPDLYEVGMSYLGQKILYEAVNRDPRFWAERVFAPPVDNAATLRSLGRPLATLESGTPLAELDAVAFSLTHEMCYSNVLYMLDLAGLPLRAADRAEHHPLVMAGGGCAFNAEPMAPFFDLMVIGDGEHVLPRIMEKIVEAKRAGQDPGSPLASPARGSRAELLRTLAGLPGVYVPSFFEIGPDGGPQPLYPDQAVIEKAVVPDLDDAVSPTGQVVPCGQAVHDRYTVEIARGCTRGCRFCQAGMIYRPVRERSVDRIGEILQEGLNRTGFEEVSLLSLSTGDFSALDALFTESHGRCKAEQVAISLPSLRVGSLSKRIMGLMADIRRTGATIAPEAGSQRLRDVINKGVTEEELLEHTRTLFANGWQTVKLYFMIGLPTETREDLLAIRDLCLKVQDTAGRHAKRLQVTASVSPFVPKPHTPFQWEPQIDLDQIRERIGFLRELFRPYKRLVLRWHEPEMSFLEGVFARGDRRLAPVVERAFRKEALFTSWSDRLELDKWLAAMAEEGIEPTDYLKARDPDRPLPWDHLNCGVSREFLLRERAKALSGKLSPDCRYGACQVCGVCSEQGKSSSILAVQARTMDIRNRLNFQQRDQVEVPSSIPPSGGEGGDLPLDFAGESASPPSPPIMETGVGPDAGNDLEAKRMAVRVFYRKLGTAACLSQLELQSVFERSLRRAGLPMSFSGGFHPMPLISFGRALPVGVWSLVEWFNLFLRREVDLEEISAFLSPVLPRGIMLTGIERLEVKRRQPQAVREEYLVRYRSPDGRAVEMAPLLADWAAFLASESFIMTRWTEKKGERSVELRPLVVGAEPRGAAGVSVVMDWSAGYVSPLHLVQAVHKDRKPAFRLIKVRQFFE